MEELFSAEIWVELGSSEGWRCRERQEAGVRVRRPWSGGTELGSSLGRRRWQKRNVTCPKGHHVIFRK